MNSTRHYVILDVHQTKFKTPFYLLRMVRSYIGSRALIYHTADAPCTKKTTAEVVQNSILGPKLRNVSYDVILRMELPQGDVIRMRDMHTLGRLNQVMRRVIIWMGEHGMALAMQKIKSFY